MRVNSMCLRCLLDRQQERVSGFPDEEKNTAYLKEVARTLAECDPEDSAPYLVYLFQQIYRKYYGAPKDFTEIKKEYNQYVMDLEEELNQKIQSSPDPLRTSFLYSRVGNYIDFGAMHHVDKKIFLELFDDEEKNALDENVYQAFLADCAKGKNFVLLADNCGEIVLDKLFLKELKKSFPQLGLKVIVRGAEVLNDATMEDADMVGMHEVASVIPNGNAIAGIVEEYVTEETIQTLDEADVILSKGQANYETTSGRGRSIYYSFLCKCDWFSLRFHVPKNTGMFIKEG